MTAGTARAGQASHFKFTFSAENVFPAGRFCDFTYDQAFTVDVNVVLSPQGELDRLTCS